jgi:hypothetical protein
VTPNELRILVMLASIKSSVELNREREAMHGTGNIDRFVIILGKARIKNVELGIRNCALPG